MICGRCGGEHFTQWTNCPRCRRLHAALERERAPFRVKVVRPKTLLAIVRGCPPGKDDLKTAEIDRIFEMARRIQKRLRARQVDPGGDDDRSR